MQTRYQLRRNSAGSGKFFRWRYANRLCDEQGRTLFSGETPNRKFRGSAAFTGPEDGSAFTFRRTSRFTRGNWALDDANGHTLIRIACPVAAQLRPEARYELVLTAAGRQLEIVPARQATESGIDRLLTCLGTDFIVREQGSCIAYTGMVSPGDGQDDYAKRAVSESTTDLFDAIKDLPRRFREVAKGNRPDDVAGLLTVIDGSALGPEVALALLIFRTYVFAELENPDPGWG